MRASAYEAPPERATFSASRASSSIELSDGGRVGRVAMVVAAGAQELSPAAAVAAAAVLRKSRRVVMEEREEVSFLFYGPSLRGTIPADSSIDSPSVRS